VTAKIVSTQHVTANHSTITVQHVTLCCCRVLSVTQAHLLTSMSTGRRQGGLRIIGGPDGGRECNEVCGFCRTDQAQGTLKATPWKSGQKKAIPMRFTSHCFVCCRFVGRAVVPVGCDGPVGGGLTPTPAPSAAQPKDSLSKVVTGNKCERIAKGAIWAAQQDALAQPTGTGHRLTLHW